MRSYPAKISYYAPVDNEPKRTIHEMYIEALIIEVAMSELYLEGRLTEAQEKTLETLRDMIARYEEKYE